MIKSLTISLFTRGDCKSAYINVYRSSKDLYLPLVPMCLKELPGVRYSCLKDSWKGHISSKEKVKVVDIFPLVLLKPDITEWYYTVIFSDHL